MRKLPPCVFLWKGQEFHGITIRIRISFLGSVALCPLSLVKILKTNLLLATALALLALAPHPAHAEGGMLGFGVGYYDIFDSDDNAADFRLEYRSATPCIWKIKPFMGAHITSEGALYGLGGLYADLELSPEWTLTPSLGAGLYSDGDGKDLGHAVEFRTQIELGYNFQNGSRLSGGLAHISNMGLDDKNPGTEILSLNYYVPISWIMDGE